MTVDYVGQLVDSLNFHGEYQPRTIVFYQEQAELVLKILADNFPGYDPSNLDRATLKALVGILRSRYTVSTQKDYLAALKKMCVLQDNHVFEEYRVMFPADTRPNVDWLTYDQATAVLNAWKMPVDDMIVTLELLHGLRRVEVIRLRVQDVYLDEGYIEVRGKGRAGGKLRTVPMHPDFPRAYQRWMAERNEIISGRYEGDIPDNLLIYRKGLHIRPYEEIKGRSIDDHIQQLSDNIGIEFSNHTLRRTFGRELYRSGVDIIVIATIYGHSSTTQTLKYLGLNLDDMAEAMEKFKLKRE